MVHHIPPAICTTAGNYSQKFRLEKSFTFFTPVLMGKIFIPQNFFLVPIPNLTTYTIGKIYSTEYFCNTSVAGYARLFTFTACSNWTKVTVCVCYWGSLNVLKSKLMALADAGFIEGGFCSCSSIAREKFGATPTFAENHAHFQAFWEKLFVLLVNPFIFDRDLC